MRNLLYFLLAGAAVAGGYGAYRYLSRKQLQEATSRKLLWIAQEIGQSAIDPDTLKGKLSRLTRKEITVLNQLLEFMITNWDNAEEIKPPKQLRADVNTYLKPLFATEDWKPLLSLFGS